MSFDLAIAGAGAAGPARYESRGAGHGSCALTCHGVRHEPGGGALCASHGEATPRSDARCVSSTY
jgi:hypothetical protein